ncbi:translation elongation factor Ts [bacterium (candidate division B38) B3_B38]|nr:MAG: translation elongation factor Ts [bacterium (candidate division B38) B3_B38]
MTRIPASLVKQLRERTSLGIMDCKDALKEAKGDLEEAIKILQKRGMTIAAKKSGKATTEGLIASYIHSDGKIGVPVEVNCETDFVASNEEFKALVKDIAMQIAALCPQWVRPEEVPPEVLEEERERHRAAWDKSGKPKEVVARIVEGKLKKFYEETCLHEQPFIRDENITIKALLSSKIAQFGENIVVKRFVRYTLGKE